MSSPLTAPTILVAQISDTHIKRPGELAYGVVDTATALETCVAFLNELQPRPDLVVVSGDLVDFGRPDEYAHFRALMEPLRLPYVVLPGNHDDRDALRASFPGHAYLPRSGALNAAVPLGALSLFLLDSSVPGKPYGRLGPDTLEWLDAELASEPERPALIFLHHPPFVTGIRHMDVQYLLDAEAFAAVIARHPRTRLIAAGHVHRTAISTIAGVPALIAAGTSHAVALDLDPAGPPAFRIEPPGFYLHAWTPGERFGRIVSHAVPIGSFGEPHPFFDAEGRLLA